MIARESTLAGRYRTLFVLGRGGMGSVEAALDTGDEQRIVALKRLLPDSARDGRRGEMFLREAKLAAMLSHPNVVRAFDFGEADGELYLAMEYVEGQPLSVVLRAASDANEKLDPALVAYVLAEACEGLHAAHELAGDDGKPLGLVHRDVSPQNVMLGYDGRVRILDFGVAKIEAESVTKTGEVKGKTAYMSPEQAMGEVIDRRSDLFGVGAVLYECLTLRRMWGDGTDMDVLRKLALEKPPELPGDAPEEIRALYSDLVEREAKDRPASASDVARALRALCGGGRDKDLRELLARHFGRAAETQRRKLEAAIDQEAPELRESLVPASARPAPAVARAIAASEPRKSPAPRWPIPAAIALAVAGLVVWRTSAAPTPAAPLPSPRAEPTASVTAPIVPPPTSEPAQPQPSVERPTPSAAPLAHSAPAVSAIRPQPRPRASGSAAPPSSKPALDIDDKPF